MTTQEAVSHYFEKKQSGELSKQEIKEALKTEHGFSDEQTIDVLKAISDLELEALQNKSAGISAIFESIYFSYFFVIFGLVAIVVSVFLLQKEAQSELSKYLPWVIIAGAVFIIGKHASIIYQRRKKAA